MEAATAIPASWDSFGRRSVQHRTERVLTPCDSRPEEALSIGAARPPPREVSAPAQDHLSRESRRRVVSSRTRAAAALNFDGFGAGRGAQRTYASASARRRSRDRRFRLRRRSRPDRRSVAAPMNAAMSFAPSRRSARRRSNAIRRSAPSRRSARGAELRCCSDGLSQRSVSRHTVLAARAQSRKAMRRFGDRTEAILSRSLEVGAGRKNARFRRALSDLSAQRPPAPA